MRGCRALTKPEIKLVLRHLRGRYQDRNRALFTLGLKSGLRIGSLLALRIEDVWDGAVLPRFYVARRTVKGRSSGFSSPMHPAAAKALELYITKRCNGLPGTAPLFWSSKRRNGVRPLDRTAAWKLLKRAYYAAGLRGKLACHSTRKTFAQRVYFALGHDLLATQRAMQHASISSTILYLSVDQQRVDTAILSI
jgi:integrase